MSGFNLENFENNKGLVSFLFDGGINVRTLVKDNDTNNVWFCLKDVCEVLGINNSRDVKNRLIADGMTPHVDSIDMGVVTGECKDGGAANQEVSMTFIAEPALYAVIFQSRKEEAKVFRKWVFEVVLPTIRKSGGYISNSQLFVNTYFSDVPDDKKKSIMDLMDRIEEQQKSLIVMKPKAEYFDKIVDRNLLSNFTKVANVLNIKRKDLISILMEAKMLYRDSKGVLTPYHVWVEKGLFETKQWARDENEQSGYQTLVTPKGVEYIKLMIE